MKITEIFGEKNLKSEMQQQNPIPKTTENLKDPMPGASFVWACVADCIAEMNCA